MSEIGAKLAAEVSLYRDREASYMRQASASSTYDDLNLRLAAEMRYIADHLSDLASEANRS